MSLWQEQFVAGELNADKVIAQICGANAVFPGIQLPSQQTPYVNYSRSKTNRTQVLSGASGLDEAVMLVEVWADYMASQFDPLCSAIIGDLDLGRPPDDGTGTVGSFLEDFRWASKEVKDNSGNDKMVLHGSLYFNVWGPQTTSSGLPVVTSVTPAAVSHGTEVTISGSGFLYPPVRAINVGAAGAAFEVVSDTQIEITIPMTRVANTVLDITVINDNGSSALSAGDQVTFQ
jgi:hypothetical protein